jgi:hypothetical protein
MSKHPQTASRFDDNDQAYMRFYRAACDALAGASRKIRSKGTKLSQIDQISALTMAHLRVAALLLAERPEIDPAIFDGEMTRHVSAALKLIAENNEYKRTAGLQ